MFLNPTNLLYIYVCLLMLLSVGGDVILCSFSQNIQINNLQFAGLKILLDLRMITSLCESY